MSTCTISSVRPLPFASPRIVLLNALHVLNDGVQASLLVLLPLIAVESGFGAMQIGGITSIHFLMGVLFAVPAAVLSRRFGGLRVLLAAALLNAGALLLLPLVAGTWDTAMLVMIAGIGFGVFHPVAFALIGRWTPAERTGRCIGWFIAVGDVGRSGVTALIAALLAVLTWQHASLVLAAGLAVAATGGLWLMRRHKPAISPERDPVAVANAAPQRMALIRPLRQNSRFAFACGIGGLDALANSGLAVFLPMLLAARGASVSEAGAGVALYFLGGVLGKVAASPLAERLGDRRALVLIQMTIAAVLTGLCTTTTLPLLLLLSAIAGILAKATLPIVLSITAASLPRSSSEVGFGVNQTILGAATTLSPLLLGAGSHFAGPGAAIGLAAGISAVAAIAVCLVRLTRDVEHPSAA